jgi:hypothetical protein
MSGLTREALIGIARTFYPTGFPVEKDDYSQPLLAHQQTAEHERWREAWKKALVWEQWNHLLDTLESTFPDGGVSDATQPWHSACRRCCIYIEHQLPAGSTVITRVAGAVSILAPVYITYVTTRIRQPDARASSTQLTFSPTDKAKAAADTLASTIESELGYSPFPLDCAGLTVPGLRVGYRNSMEPTTLLDALFSDDLGNLP